MSQSRRNYRQAAYDKRTGGRGESSRSAYVYGNTVRKSEIQKQLETEKPRQMQPSVRKNREKARHMNAGYVLFLAVALCAAALILVNYIQLDAELTNRTKAVAEKERSLNELKEDNDEKYNRIVRSIDLEEIRRIAIGELGMTYAQEGQIRLYKKDDHDYMRKVSGSNQ